MNKPRVASQHWITHLPYLAMIAKTGSFTGAAGLLHVSQAAVSYQIRQLEQKIGQTLVKRQSGGTTRLTSSGEQLAAEYQMCERRLQLLLGDLQEGGGGLKLRVTAPFDLGSLVLPSAIARLRELAPDLSFISHLGDENVDLRTSEWDLALTFNGQERFPSEDIVFSSPMRIVASPGYLAAKGEPARLSQLNDHTILRRWRSQDRSWRRLCRLNKAAFDRLMAPPRAVWIELGNTFAMAEGARQGLGIALLPHFCVDRALRAGELVSLLPGLRVFEAEFALRAFEAPQIEAILPLVRQVFGELADQQRS